MRAFAAGWRRRALRLGVRRVLAVTPALESRGDTSAALALGAHAYELDADRAEIARALGGTPTASPLFVGHDGVPYKRAYAAVGDAGDVAGLVAVEGTADYPAGAGRVPAIADPHRRRRAARGAAADDLAVAPHLAAGRASGAGGGAPRARRPGRADPDRDARRDRRAGPDAGGDARGAARTRRAHADDAGRHRARGAQSLGGLELYAGLLRDALAGQPERLDEVARIEREVGHLKAVVSEFLEFARRPAPRLEAVALRPLFEEIRELTAAPGGATMTVEAADGLAVRGRRRPSCGARC